jgi:hypothetical protein
MLYHYGDTIVPNVNSNITCNSESILLLNDNIDMLYAEKNIIYYGFRWNYNKIDVEII